MSLLPRCMYCDTAGEGDALVAIAAIATGSGPGWAYHACRDCRVQQRLVPLAAHPSTSRGGLHHWPGAVPHELVARLADLGDAPQLRPICDRLFPAVAAALRREIAQAEVDAAVADLRAAAGRGGLTAIP